MTAPRTLKGIASALSDGHRRRFLDQIQHVDLLDPLAFTFAEINANGVFDIGFQPGVTNCHITIELDCQTGAVSVEFPGPIAPASDRKGWDGSIYGPDRPVKKPPQNSRVTVIPPATPGLPPLTDLYLYASGMAALPIEEPSIGTQSASKPRKRWGDGHVTLMKAYDEDSVEFAVTSSGGGVGLAGVATEASVTAT